MYQHLTSWLCFLLLPSMAAALCSQDSITIQVRTDQYASETSWQLYNQNTSALVSSRSTFSNNTLHTDKICISSTDCYLFVINDTEGDGICCTRSEEHTS